MGCFGMKMGARNKKEDRRAEKKWVPAGGIFFWRGDLLPVERLSPSMRGCKCSLNPFPPRSDQQRVLSPIYFWPFC